MKLNKILSGIALLSVVGAVSAQETVVKIGHSGPLSGSQAFSGKDNENGARLAIEELNAKPISVGGKVIKFELQSEDDQGDPKSGVSAAQKLIDNGVKFVVGPYNSGVTMPASRTYNDAGVLVATVSSNPKITEQGYKNLFRINASDSQLGSKMVSPSQARRVSPLRGATFTRRSCSSCALDGIPNAAAASSERGM